MHAKPSLLVDAKIVEVEPYRNLGEEISQEYTLLLTIGECSWDLHGWIVAGFLGPDDGRDIDGSARWTRGVEWSWAHDDGMYSGRIRVQEEDRWDTPEPNTPIIINQGESWDNVVIRPKDIPQWNSVLKTATREEAENFRSEFKKTVSDAINRAIDKCRELGEEPTPESLWEGIRPYAHRWDEARKSEIPGKLRVGHWLEVTPMLVYVDKKDRYNAVPFPSREDIKRAFKACRLSRDDAREIRYIKELVPDDFWSGPPPTRRRRSCCPMP
jgi:hypothetical protein